MKINKRKGEKFPGAFSQNSSFSGIPYRHEAGDILHILPNLMVVVFLGNSVYIKTLQIFVVFIM